ncbi:DNA helicase II [bacterium BMS3Bbin12]|nr:DNA helicase II [bacterium BMS3Bbin12]GBE51534.1 DNA helicase II [bacterium BMS3Bbin13]
MALVEVENRILKDLTGSQIDAVKSPRRRVLVVAGAGSGKTEVMARRIAWWVGVEGVSKDRIVALTFTEKAAEEMKFRVRRWIGNITPVNEDINLNGMYVGTIHGFCLAKIREYWPDDYHNYDVLDEVARMALILRGFNGILGLQGLRAALGANTSQSETVDQFIRAYDQLHEHNRFEVALPPGVPPYRLGGEEREWCREARFLTDVGDDRAAQAFSISAERYYAYLRCRRFLDFSTSQTEFLRKLERDDACRQELAAQQVHVVVDEIQDINPIQLDIIKAITGASGKLTVVGDHRQSIYGFRGAKVEIIGELWNEFRQAADAGVVDLRQNFRSTSRIIEVANRWAKSITAAGGMETPEMLHGKAERVDTNPSHVALVEFEERHDEAAWLAEAIRALVPSDTEGAEHDRRDGTMRGIALSDIAVLVRSSTNVRTYMRALEDAGVPSVVRAGPDLFSQPEVLFFIGALALSGGIEEFYGSPHDPKSLPSRIRSVLGCQAEPKSVLRGAAQLLRNAGLALDSVAEDRVFRVAQALNRRIAKEGQGMRREDIKLLRSRSLRKFLSLDRPVRRVFPQQIYHWLLTEAEAERWDMSGGRGEAAMFHLGTLSGLITGLETPGWTGASDYKWQIIGLCRYGAEDGRTPEQPLIVQPDAVTISTIHGAKGLEFAAVFLADVCANRFPSSYAKRRVMAPLSGSIVEEIDIGGLSDNDNNDGERRLMYVALTRAERFLVISRSGKRTSRFIRELRPIISEAGGIVTKHADELLRAIRHAPLELNRDTQLATSFSDLRYYLCCPHDFYLRKVLGFSPTIDQAFGYGRGVHNLMRAVHSDPTTWAALAKDRQQLEASLNNLVDRGLFYLRYTTGDPAENMRAKGVRIVADYIEYFGAELRNLTFEPEKEFETLIEYGDGDGGAIVSGAVDIVRLDDPPRVTLIDFKSGDPRSDQHQSLDEEEMRLQVGIYAVAAKQELEYEPDRGLVRHLDVNRGVGETGELEVPLDSAAVEEAKRTVVGAARAIRDRRFFSNPRKHGQDGKPRCKSCDFLGLCGMEAAINFKRKKPGEL